MMNTASHKAHTAGANDTHCLCCIRRGVIQLSAPIFLRCMVLHDGILGRQIARNRLETGPNVLRGTVESGRVFILPNRQNRLL